MYHCHFEDVEHVQMGMTGIVFVRPLQDGTLDSAGFTKFAYNDGDGSTGYHRHFAILLNEVWKNFHDGDRDIQESIATDYDPQWFTLNGRCYPQTVLPNDDPSLPANLRIGTHNPNYDTDDYSQPNSALIQVQPGRAGAAAAGQPRLPAARHAAARASRCTSSARTRRCCATATGRHVVLDQHALHRARRGPRRAVRRAGVQPQPGRPGRTAGATTTSTASGTGTGGGCRTSARRRSRRDDDRGAGVPEPPARPDRREPDLCLSSATARRGRRPTMMHKMRRLGSSWRSLPARRCRGGPRRRRDASRSAPSDRHGLHTRHRRGRHAHVQPGREHRLHRDPGRQQRLHVELRERRRVRTPVTSRAPVRCSAPPRARPSSSTSPTTCPRRRRSCSPARTAA